MKRTSGILYQIGLLCMLMLAASCHKKDKEKPEVATEAEVKEAEESTEEFFEALEDQDFEEAQTHVTVETQPILASVMEEAQQQEKATGEKPEISVVILDRKPLLEQVHLTVQITVGKKVRKDTLRLVLVDGDWRIVLPKKQLALIRLVIFHEPMQIILVEGKKHKHHPRGHAYGHYKHKHGHDD